MECLEWVPDTESPLIPCISIPFFEQREADHSKEIGALKQNEFVRELESRSSGL